jgi:membrane protease YdiL (CAAX protease family)
VAERRNILAALALCLGGPALVYVLVALNADIFERMAIFYAVVVPVALLSVKLPWKQLLRFDFGLAAVGVLLGIAMYALGGVGFALLGLVAPEFAETASTFYGWLDAANGITLWLMILWVIIGEEIVWRMAVTLPLAARWKSAGVAIGAVGFAAVHLAWGPPLLLLAALVFGAFWSVIAWRTRNFWCVLISHLVWDALVMNLARYA